MKGIDAGKNESVSMIKKQIATCGIILHKQNLGGWCMGECVLCIHQESHDKMNPYVLTWLSQVVGFHVTFTFFIKCLYIARFLSRKHWSIYLMRR